jgi:hypothetical protein
MDLTDLMGEILLFIKKMLLPNRNLLGVDIRDMLEDTTNNLLWVLPR